jgi:hypothetical protein
VRPAQPGRTARWVKWSGPHFGQCRSSSAGWLPAAIDETSRSSSPRSMFHRLVTEIIEIELTRRPAADRGTRQEYPQLAQVRSYSLGVHGNRMR